MSEALRFVRAANEDREINERVAEAMRKGATVTNEEIIRIAQAAGYTLTYAELLDATREYLRERFAAGDIEVVDDERDEASPESSCASGCLSYTKSWHPYYEGVDG